ncbi:MAG TPA: hypothetical protein VMU86_00580 [Steroidobacteraceae bacterium]|nr:hypothetical protein [Steroidobacteraceae bacterium]
MKSSVAGAAQTFNRLRSTLNTSAVHAGARQPFKFLLCGDPALVAAFRSVLLRGTGTDTIPPDAAAALETVVPGGPLVDLTDARAVLFFATPADRAGAPMEALAALKLPVFAVLADEAATATSGPAQAPAAGAVEEYLVPAIEFEWLRARILPHLIDVCRNVEIAVGRRLPMLRTTVAAKLTRDAALNALKVSGASALIDNVPVVGVFLGAFVSAGDMMAITGIQMMLMLQIRATFGKDPDVAQMWELLPIVGGGFGWRALARELSGFIPVGGIFIKSAIAYAGTVVVGEGATFYELHGRHMASVDAARVYEDARASAQSFARDVLTRIRRNGSP